MQAGAPISASDGAPFMRDFSRPAQGKLEGYWSYQLEDRHGPDNQILENNSKCSKILGDYHRDTQCNSGLGDKTQPQVLFYFRSFPGHSSAG